MPLSVHLASVARQTGRRPAGLDGPACPPEAAHVWHWFLTLTQHRGHNGFSPNPLSFLEVWAWAELTGCQILPSEVDALMRLDRRWCEILGSPGAGAAKPPAAPVTFPKPSPNR